MTATEEPRHLVREALDSIERTSWWPRPFGENVEPPAPPDLLTRSDGVALLYPGRLHAVIGETEVGKTWLAYLAVLEAVLCRQHALIVDFEDVAATAWSRLLALGLDAETINEYVHFAHPEEALIDRNDRWTNARHDLTDAIATWSPAVAVFDGVTVAMELEGLNPLDNVDIARWYRHVPRLAASAGAATVIPDHVTKSREDRGRYALGAVHKLNAIDGAAYTLDMVKPFAPGQTGIARVRIAKDRPGLVRAAAVEVKDIGVFTLVSADGRATATLGPPTDERTSFEPTALMEKVSRHLDTYPGATKSDLRALGKAETVDLAVQLLVNQQFIRIEQHGRSHRHYNTRPYSSREAA